MADNAQIQLPAMSKKDLYLAVMAVTSTIATIASAIGSFLPEPTKGYLIAAGVVSSALHAALLDPKIVAVIGGK